MPYFVESTVVCAAMLILMVYYLHNQNSKLAREVGAIENYIVQQHETKMNTQKQSEPPPQHVANDDSDDEGGMGSTYVGGDANRAPPRQFDGSSAQVHDQEEVENTSQNGSNKNNDPFIDPDDLADEMERQNVLGMR